MAISLFKSLRRQFFLSTPTSHEQLGCNPEFPGAGLSEETQDFAYSPGGKHHPMMPFSKERSQKRLEVGPWKQTWLSKTTMHCQLEELRAVLAGSQ